MTNPLLAARDLPAFAEIRPEHVTPALDVLLPEASAALERAVGTETEASYDALSATLDVPLERLSRAWGAVAHLNAVVNTPELRQAYNDNLNRVTEFHTRLGADERLYAKYKSVSANATGLTIPRRRALDNAIRDFVLSGAELQGEARERFAAIQARHAEVAQKFSEHVLDATDGFSLLATEEQMAGVPDDVRQAARDAAQADAAAAPAAEPAPTDAAPAKYKVTLHQPSWMPVMQYAHDRALREQLYRAYVTRASEFGPAELDNTALMSELLSLRREEAALLGHASYAELSLVPKMAQSPAQVAAFLRDLAARARPHAERDVDELRRFAAERLGLPDLQPWDIPYASEKLKEERYAFSEQEVKQYFTEPRVLDGLFRLIETLFDVAIRPDTAPVWHDSVRFFRIERSAGDGSAPALVGQFYLDLYARPGKRPGAWMDDVRSRWLRPEAQRSGGSAQTPVAHLVCNFASPVGDKPALLTHDDVITLFHEFGHGLHHMLTRVDDLAVSGISGVEWDAVELPSQFMENFCWEWEVLSRMSAHVDTGAPLPRELFDRMLAARNFQSGMQTLRQIEFALFDMRVHTEADAAGRIQAIVDEVRAEVSVLRPPAYNRFQHTFSHIFAGGYSAGYYSYKWAEVLSADAYAAFEESGVFDPSTGLRFRREILEAGGSRPAMESFKAFRGREPRIDALLRHQGMAPADAVGAR
jgi:oligopeptidase A